MILNINYPNYFCLHIKYIYFKIRAVFPKRTSADLAMTTVKEEKIALEEIERSLMEKQNLLEQQKIEYEETITEKENGINRVS